MVQSTDSLKEQFVRAIAFCLRADVPEGEARALAEWALTPDDYTPAPGDETLTVALVSGGATKIKSYVFESARLPEIRGASGLLDRINRMDVPGLWSEAEPHGLGCKDCIIYANGGEVLAFAPRGEARRLADRIESIYAGETLVAQSVAVWEQFTLRQLRDGLLSGEKIDEAAVRDLLGYDPSKNNTFGSLVAALAAERQRRRESNGEEGTEGRNARPARAHAHIETVPFARRCSSCERRGAVIVALVGDERRPLCEPCARKRVYGQMAKGDDQHKWDWFEEKNGFVWKPRPQDESWAGRFSNWLKQQPEEVRRGYNAEGARPTEDLSEIAQASQPEGFIGVVYADGNNMGALLEKLRTPIEYAEFAAAVYETLEKAVYAALARRLDTKEVTDDKGKRALVHPFEILSIGGDDLLLIVPADAALPVACDIAEEVEHRLREHHLSRREKGYAWQEAQRCEGTDADSEQPQSKVSLSAGVVIADAHTPVFYLEQLADQLLKSAKGRAKWLKRKRGFYGGTIDFLALKALSIISGEVDDFRKATQEHRDPDDPRREHRSKQFYARPYTVAETRMLIETVKLLKKNDFPRSQLYRLRGSLREGEGREQSTIDYLYFLTRNAEQTRLKIEKIWAPPESTQPPHPWRRRLEEQEGWETVWGDIAELYDFVPREEEGVDAES